MTAPGKAFQATDWVPRAATLLLLGLAAFSFLKARYFEPGNVWLAGYSDETTLVPFTIREGSVNHLWGKNNQPPPEGLDPRTLRVRWVSCLHSERPLDLSLQLVSAGEARLSISGTETLNVQEGSGRGAQGKVIHLEPGAHGFRVEFTSQSARPAVALNASFDGKAPLPMPSPLLPTGVRWSRPGTLDSDPCAGP